jgi:ADP-ribose pyrophosphatase YjhB (NUDIX family)
MLPEVISCGALPYRIVDNNIEILLVQHVRSADKSWGIPKGKQEKNEIIQDCILREVKEETGLSVVRLEDPLANVSYVKNAIVKRLIACLAVVENGVPTPIDRKEISQAQFFKVTDLPLIHRYQLSLVKEAIRLIRAKKLTIDDSSSKN